LGSQSLQGLADCLELPGSLWLVDMPGDGSNLAPESVYALWPQVLLEATQCLPHCVYVGHSTGGMYLLSLPQLETRLKALVLISSAPDASWQPAFASMMQQHPLPQAEAASQRFEQQPNVENLRTLLIASAEWNFTATGVEAGRQMLAALPCNLAAMNWSSQNFDQTYQALWWPQRLPTLIVSGAEDQIVTQSLWQQPRFCGRHVQQQTIAAAGHFPWVEQPQAVSAAFASFALLLS
jgi:pimeloyl-ACP methyl ester carboxylesterase